jgi:lysophospholipase L1-like esterase
VSPEEHAQNLRALYDTLKARDIPVILLDLFTLGPWEEALHRVVKERRIPSIDGEGYLTDLLEKVKNEDPACEAVRRWAVGRYGEEALNLEPWLYLFNDNCHPNAKGYALLASHVADVVIERFIKGG